MIEVFIKGLFLILLLFLAAAYMTFLERIVLARLQQRLGPNRAGPFGLLQPIADGIKLLMKESFRPAQCDWYVYWLAPCFSVFAALAAFGLIPFGGTVNWFGSSFTLQIANVDTAILWLLASSSLAVYGVVLSGWASNSRYAFLGGIRGTAQMISYELAMGLVLVGVAAAAGSLNLQKIVDLQRQEGWLLFRQPIGFFLYLLTGFAETNRAPFDLPEAEQELTAGYHTEYGGLRFALFFLAEYIHILVICSVTTTLFLGGWHGPFGWPLVWFMGKVACLVFLFFWARATLPRLRYDQLLSFGWKVLLPVAALHLLYTTWWRWG